MNVRSIKPYFYSLAVLLLFACQWPALPSPYMAPSVKAYQSADNKFYLKNKIALGVILTKLPKNQEHQFQFFPTVLETALRQANLYTSNNATYLLNAEIKDVSGKCEFTVCESGSAIHYTLEDSKSHVIKYDQVVVVPYTCEFPGLVCALFGCDRIEYMRKAYGGAIGENIAHVILVLSSKTQSDLR